MQVQAPNRRGARTYTVEWPMYIKSPYDKELRELLYEVFETGVGRVEWSKLKRWLRVIRVTNRVWEELQERWLEVINELEETHESDNGWRLAYLDWDTDHCKTFLTLICMDPTGEGEMMNDDASWVLVESKLSA